MYEVFSIYNGYLEIFLDYILLPLSLIAIFVGTIIAIYQNEIIGYIIGIPIEKLSREPWARKDVNFGKSNTLYTYAFVIKERFFGNGYARLLKKVFLSNVAKRENLDFVTGHVISGRTAKFKGNISLIENVHNWQGTGLTFEYYRRIL